MQLISNFNKEIRFLLGVIDIFSKYVWVTLVKDKKGITIKNAYQKKKKKKKWKESNRKPNKIWVDKASKFYKRSVKSW